MAGYQITVTTHQICGKLPICFVFFTNLLAHGHEIPLPSPSSSAPFPFSNPHYHSPPWS